MPIQFDNNSPDQLNQQIDAVEKQLRGKGLETGHVLAVKLPTSTQFVATLFASIRIGAVFCPLNLRLPDTQIQEQLNLLNPKLFVSESGIQTYVTSPKSLKPSSFLLFTSGSTATAKIVHLSIENFFAAAQTAIAACQFEMGDTWLLSLPLFHVGGLSLLFRAFLAKAAITTDPSHPSITHLSYVPTHLYRAWPIYPRLKTLLLSGAPIHEIPERLPILAAYGMTETASMIIGHKKPFQQNGLTYLGFPHAGKQIRLSAEGEILIRGDSLFQGYWDGTHLHPPSEWFPTNDLAVFHPNYGFAITGRKDNQFVSGGEKIQPEEVEQILLKHPEIIEAIVVPRNDLEFGQRPIAFLKTLYPIDEKKLKNYLLDKLPKYKIPIEFLPLPSSLQEVKISRKSLSSK